MNISGFKEKIIKSILGPLWDEIKPTLQLVGSEAGRIALSLAKKFVIAAATDPVLRGRSGKDRAAWVQDQIRQTSAQSGNPLADRIINLAIEVAYNQYIAATGKK